MRLLAVITDPSVARRILECLALPPRAPPMAPVNEIDLRSVVSHNTLEPTLAQAHGDPGIDFDQSLAEDRFSNEDS